MTGREELIPQRTREAAAWRVRHRFHVGLAMGAVSGDRQESILVGERGDGDTIDAHSIFEIGSLTKVFTALLLADSVARGELRLEQTVGELFAQKVPCAPLLAERTLLQLATHTAGLPRNEPWPLGDPDNPLAHGSERRVLDALASLEPGPPGAYGACQRV